MYCLGFGSMPVSPLFFIVGPTGVGKTNLAVEVAAQCNGEIIGADAFQVYTGMGILTAKPSPELRAKVPHHLIDLISPRQKFDVAQYLEIANRAAIEITRRGRLPIVVGGTGLYVKALTHGLSDLPKADPELRLKLERLTLEELQQRLIELDPVGATQIDFKNPRRLIRAIEVCELTGKPFSSFQNKWSQPTRSVSGFFLTRDRDELYSRIDERVEEMMRDGLLDEVQALKECGATASQAIGIKEARACLKGEITMNECVAQIQQTSRHYAKRQMTWFKRESVFEPINLSELKESAVEFVTQRRLRT